VQQRKQDADGFLLIPREHEGERQLVDGASKSARQSHSDLNGAVSVVALAHIHDAGQPGDGAEIEVVEAVFTTGQSEDNGILGGLLHKIGVVIAAGLCAVAAAYEEEVADLAGFYSLYYFICYGKYGAVGETCGHLAASVDAGESGLFCISAQLQSLFYDRSEVLV